ncbi:unnamed protein product [Paramecium sonneborni]|uniref:WD40-repeat-containing domain n=1 Tax=Paramecium sonneborni TaxID=65129 RepID=A0A8S1MB82_9CILI|nr:unnamed protein product [Paramecium sonneborni]
MGNNSINKQNTENQQKQPDIQLPVSKINYCQFDEVQQIQVCQALSFNKQGTLLATTIKSDIKIWIVDQGKLIDQNIILKGHTQLIRCLVFSRKLNWLISGADDQEIRCWKENELGYGIKSWKSSNPFKIHKNYRQLNFKLK